MRKRKRFSRAETQRRRQYTSSPCTRSTGRPHIVLSSWSVPFPQPLCADGGRAILLETNSLGQPLHHCPSAPGKFQSSISSCSLNTEWEGRHRETGCSKARQRQSEGLLFLSTPGMMLYEFTDLTHFKRTTRKLHKVCTPNSSPKWDIQCPVTIATFLSKSRTNQISDALHYCNCENKMDKITIDILLF